MTFTKLILYSLLLTFILNATATTQTSSQEMWWPWDPFFQMLEEMMTDMTNVMLQAMDGL